MRPLQARIVKATPEVVKLRPALPLPRPRLPTNRCARACRDGYLGVIAAQKQRDAELVRKAMVTHIRISRQLTLSLLTRIIQKL